MRGSACASLTSNVAPVGGHVGSSNPTALHHDRCVRERAGPKSTKKLLSQGGPDARRKRARWPKSGPTVSTSNAGIARAVAPSAQAGPHTTISRFRSVVI